jgi:hypothetical protein
MRQFQNLAHVYVIRHMFTIAETRLARLQMLIKLHGNSIANLNEAIGLERTDATISQIRNKSVHSKSGKPRAMGDDLARKIENKLTLEVGWMDTPPSPTELHGEDDPRTKVWQLLEALPPDQWPTAVRLLDALAQPAKATGTGGKQ